MIYEEVAPAHSLRGWIAQFWRFEMETCDLAEHDHIIVPDGTVSLTIVKSRGGTPAHVGLTGPSVRAHQVTVRPELVVWGVRFQPGAAGPLLRVEVPALRDRLLNLASVARLAERRVLADLGDACDFANARERLSGLVVEWASTAQARDKAVARLVEGIVQSHGARTIAELSSAIGLSGRHLRRRFYAALGLTPKEFARLRRIRWACVRALEVSQARWSRVSADSGYADQAHLVRDFRAVFGRAPKLLEAYIRQIQHHGVTGSGL